MINSDIGSALKIIIVTFICSIIITPIMKRMAQLNQMQFLMQAIRSSGGNALKVMNGKPK